MTDVKPINTGRLDDYGAKSAPILRSMLRETFVYVEGPSDFRFYKGLMDGSPALHFVDGRWNAAKKKKTGGCDFVLKAWSEYCDGGQTQESCSCKEDIQDCIFCIDRDFREQLDIPPEDDYTGTLYYQLCTGKYGEGYNDLECVLVDLPLYEMILNNKYRVPIEVAQEMLDHAIDVAAVLGCYRMGNRVAKGESEYNIFWQDNQRDYVDTEGHGSRKEIGVYYLFQSGAADVKDGLVELDEGILQRTLNYMGGNKSDIELALDESQKFKRAMLAGDKLDYCRGHDITYLLCMELRDRLQDLSLTVKMVEDALAELICQRAVAQKCRQLLAEYEFVKKLEEIVN